MRFIDFFRSLARARRVGPAVGLGALAACHSPMPADTAYHPGASVSNPAADPAASGRALASRPARSADEYKLQMANRLVAANPSISYLTPAQNPLLAIPILEVEVNADGSVRNITVTRQPVDDDAQDTIQIAIDAVRRAAPFGDVRQVPRPWKFTQVFLFDQDRRFKPRVLD